MEVVGALKMSMGELISLVRENNEITGPVLREHAQGLLSISIGRREEQ